MNLSRLLFRLLLGSRLPLTSGECVAPALKNRLLIRRDQWGIPHIDAENEEDGYYGVGFCQGQDRSFQLEMLLRVTRGTLAELFGSAAVPADRLSRRIGFHHASKEQWPVLDGEVQALLEAYAAGVNAGRSVGSPRRAHEFFLLGSRPSPWTPLDSLAVIKLISFTLSTNWDVELARLRLLESDGPEALEALDPAYPAHLPLTTPPGATAGRALDYLGQDLAVFMTHARMGGGSNNWAVAGSRTRSGRPLLANDPHLDAALPAHWYLVHIKTPQWETAGASFMGGPSILAGHNGKAAWGLTAGLVDNTDLVREEVGPDEASVRRGAAFLPCPVRDEVIAVKGASPVSERVVMTPHGPIISQALRETQHAVQALALRATWLDKLPLRGLLMLHKVRSFEELRNELSVWPATSQNVAYADTEGAIGWQLCGAAPCRRKGYGLLPLDGADPEVGWEADPVPFDQMPFLLNPDEGFLATANNQPTATGPFLGADWIDGYRCLSIRRNLAARSDWDVTSTMKLQTDQRSIPWEEMRDAVLAIPAADEDARVGLDLLRGWDGVVSAESPAAAVFELFVVQMVTRLARSKAPKGYSAAIGRGDGPLTGYNFFAFRRTGHLVGLLRTQPDGWFAAGWSAEIADALASVVRKLRVDRGSDPSSWAWGRLRTLTMTHPFGRGRVLAAVYNLGPIPFGGDADTINQGSVRPLEPFTRPDSIASLRAVVDVGAWGNCRWVLPAGQSGNPLSPHYGDQWPLWQRGQGVPIAWGEDAVQKATRSTLTLRATS